MEPSVSSGEFDVQTYFRGVRKTREESLQKLIGLLKAPGNTQFQVLFKHAQDTIELKDVIIADGLKISRPTVGRWARGESSPHPLGRPSIYNWLIKEAAKKLKQDE
jgi:hypothetical protein